MKSEDKVLLSQKKTSVDPTFNPALYKLMKIDSTILTLQRGDTVITRNLSKMMLVITGAEVKNKEHDIDDKDDIDDHVNDAVDDNVVDEDDVDGEYV